MGTIEEFRIAIPQADLDDLRELAGYWRTGFDWRVHERRLNEFGEWTDGGLGAVDRDQMLANIAVYWSEFDRGGHFAAMEEPDLLVADVREFFRRFR
jgi:pimeloyl-ACP methyl ester carboxylesterase